LWHLEPERAHGLAVFALCHAPSWALPDPGDDHGLDIQLWKRSFASPIGLAAGFDKDAKAIAPLFRLGFGFVEIGGVTARPQPGNPRPRLFRLTEDRAVINRLGLNSRGADAVRVQLASLGRDTIFGPLGVNIGLNKESTNPEIDYADVAKKLSPFVDMITINVSSPNTPGLRALQNPDFLATIVSSVRTAVATLKLDHPPAVLVKLAPDLTEEDIGALTSLALQENFDGLIISNTTIGRPDTLQSRFQHEAGGLSGQPLMDSSTQLLKTVYALTEGRIPLIGVGGVASAQDVYAKVRAGASLVQLYSALVYEGPGLVGRLKSELRNLLVRDGYTTVAAAVGADHR